MTPEMEQHLFTSLGKIEAGISNLNDKLEAHARQDVEHFAELGARLAEAANKISGLQIVNAKEEGSREALEKIGRQQGSLWGGIASLVTFGVIEAAKKLLGF